MKNNNSKNPFGGIILGIIMLIGGTILLWWNEGENVKNINAVKEVKDKVVTVSSDKVDSSNEDKLILTSGNISNNGEEIKDESFGVSVNSSLLKRNVEVYCWVETENNNDNTTTYSYSKEWRDDLVDSSNFHESGHTNPTSLVVDDKEIAASKVSVGAFTLSDKQKTMLGTDAKFGVNDANLDLAETYNVSEGYVTTATNLSSPEVGDIRISWTYNDWKDSTILAVQKGDSFADFVSKDGKKINRVEKGTLTADELILKMENENKMMKWLFRGLGALLIVLGYASILSPISKLTSFIPVVGGIVGGIVGLISFIVGLIHSLIIIIIAWFRFRPILAVILLVVIAALVVTLITLLKKGKKSTVTEAKVVE